MLKQKIQGELSLNQILQCGWPAGLMGPPILAAFKYFTSRNSRLFSIVSLLNTTDSLSCCIIVKELSRGYGQGSSQAHVMILQRGGGQ